MKTTEQKQTYWFKPKPYGLGYVPISWQRWAMTAGLVAMILLIGYANYIFRPGSVSPNGQDIAMFIAEIIILTVLMCILMDKKSSGPLGWRWGNK